MEHILNQVFGHPLALSVIIGLGGGLMALNWQKEKITIRRALLVIYAGVISSVFVGGFFGEWFHMEGESLNFIRFVSSLTALSLFEAIMLLAHQLKNDPIGFIKKFFTNGSNKSSK